MERPPQLSGSNSLNSIGLGLELEQNRQPLTFRATLATSGDATTQEDSAMVTDV